MSSRPDVGSSTPTRVPNAASLRAVDGTLGAEVERGSRRAGRVSGAEVGRGMLLALGPALAVTIADAALARARQHAEPGAERRIASALTGRSRARCAPRVGTSASVDWRGQMVAQIERGDLDPFGNRETDDGEELLDPLDEFAPSDPL